MKKPLLFILLLLLVGVAFADNYTIGTGTSSTSYSPFYGLYDYGWNKIIYTAAEINTAGLTGPASIQGLGFYAYNTPANYVMLDQKVYVRHTALSSYGTATDETGTGYPASAGFTQVFNADVVYNGLGWYYLMFTTPFAWNGTSNLEIFYENWDGDYYSGYPTHTYTATGSTYMTVYKYADNAYPTTVGTRTYNRPNMRIVTSPVDAAPTPNLVFPANGVLSLLDTNLTWNNAQGQASTYDVYLGTTASPAFYANTADMVFDPTLAGNQTYYWKVVAQNSSGPGTASSVWSFTTPGDNQLAESFEGAFPPVGWGNPGGFTRSTTTPYHLTAGAYKSTAAAAMLYTPMLELTETSSLNFWAKASASTGIGRIQIKYSEDGSAWTALGDPIAMPTNTNWNNYVVDLSSLAGNNYYIGFENYSSTATSAGIYIDFVLGPDFAELTPDPATAVYPLHNGWAFLDGVLSWTPATTGGIPASYDVYFGTTDPPAFVVNQTALTYTPTLAAGTIYYWKIVPRNGTGPATGCPVWSFKTPSANQIAESFDATDFPPLGWTTPGGAFTRSTTTPYYGAATAYEYIAAGPSYLYTPMLELTETSELDWWMRTSATTGIGRVQIVYSDDGATWNDVGDEIVMPIETTWMNYNVDLSSLAGDNYMIGFKVYSSTTTSTYFYIDHVFGPELAALSPEPATLIYPADDGWAFMDGTLQWNAPASGGLPTSYDVYFGTTDPPAFVVNQTALTYTPTLAAGTTYYWQIVPINDSGDAENCPVWSFKTPVANQLAESFDATGFPPLGWANPGTWSRSTTTPFYGAATAYKSASTTPAILSTPLVSITTGSTLDFYYRTGSTNGYGLLNIKYSTDRVTWNQIGATISLPTTTTWNYTSVSLNAIAGGNYYLGFEAFTSTSTSSIYIDHVFGPQFAAVAPGPVALTAPADTATDVARYPVFTWTAPTTGGIPAGYKIYCDTNSNPTTLLQTITDPTVLTWTSTTALNYLTVYYWSVVAYNASGDAVGNPIRSFTTIPDPTIYTIPWLEDFGTTGTTFPPTNWFRGTGVLADPSTVTSSTIYWIQDNWLNDTTVTPVNYSARMNIYTTSRYGWLITPPIQMPGTGYQLELDIALTDYGNGNVPELPSPDDKFIILVGDGATWTPANILREYNNTGSPYVYDTISNTGVHLVFPLDSFTGIKQIAFYGESTVSNADNDFFVDNVMIRQTPAGAPEHVDLQSPPDGSPALDPEAINLTWTASLTGGTPAYYEVYVGVDPIDPGNDYYGEYFYETTNTSLDLSAQNDIELGYNNTWYWAVLPYNSDGLAPDPDSPEFMVWNFTTAPDPTITTLPHVENFDDVTAPALPYGWTSVVEASTTSAYVNTYSSTTYAVSPPNSARLYNSTDVAANLLLIPPDFSMPLNTIKVRFYARSSTAGEDLYIGAYNPATEVFTQIGSVMDLTTSHTQYTVPLSSYAGTDTFLAFKHGVGTSTRTIYIDNVEFIEMISNDLAATAITGPAYLNAGSSYDYTVTVYNEGTAAQNTYTVNLMQGASVVQSVNVTTPLASGATAQHTLSYVPATGGTFGLSGKVVLTGDGNAANDQTPVKAVFVMDDTMDMISVGNDATTTSGYYIPINLYYRNNVSEELYFTDEMHLQSGTIAAIVYKNTSTNARLGKGIKIWMAHTTATDLSGGWLPSANYTLVFDGLVDFPAGVNYIVIPLTTPFAYTGGTLATRVYRVFDSGSITSTEKFYYTTNAAHSTRSRYLQNDSTVYDPMAPSAAGTTLNYFPNTSFIVQNAVMETGAILNGYVYETGGTTPVSGATVTLTDERYVATTDANGFYEFSFWEAHTVNAVASKTDYYNSTPVTGIALTMGNTVSQNLYLQPLPNLTVSGTVTSNDYPAGLVGATVKLYGYHNYETTTGAGGAFSIPNVKGNSAGSAYTYEIKKDGYTTQSGSFNLLEANYSMGTINLTEYLWPAYDLVAAHDAGNASLVWDPAGAPDYFFFDFEENNGEWLESGYGDWEWTNTYNVANYNSAGGSTGQVPPTAAHSGTGLWGTVIYGPYANSGAYSLLRKNFDLSGFTNTQLRYWLWNDLFGHYDYLTVRINGVPVDSVIVRNSSWQERVVNLSAYDNNPSVTITFAAYATTGTNYAGGYIDDIYIGPATRAQAAFGARNNDRWFLNYDVYRLLAADENNPTNWTLLGDDVANPNYLDTGFATVPGALYKWAVKANYSASLESEPVISNSLGKVYDPQDISATKSGSNVLLNWTAEPGAAYYKVYAADDPYGTFTYLGYSQTNSYTITAPVAAKKFYKVTAIADEALPGRTK